MMAVYRMSDFCSIDSRSFSVNILNPPTFKLHLKGSRFALFILFISFGIMGIRYEAFILQNEKWVLISCEFCFGMESHYNNLIVVSSRSITSYFCRFSIAFGNVVAEVMNK